MSIPTDEQYRESAAEQYGYEGSIEIDSNAVVSRADEPDADGAYVQAWVWIADYEVPHCTYCLEFKEDLRPVADFSPRLECKKCREGEG